MLKAKALGEPAVRKILLDSLDADDFEKHLAGSTLEKPQNPNLALAFSKLRDWVGKKSLTELGTFLYRLKNQCTVIRLEVSDAKDAFKLFETIDNRGLRLSPTDIIKNFILGNAARFGLEPLELARKRWAELIIYLDGTSVDGFLRQFLIAQTQRRVTVSYVIPTFKSLFMRGVTEAAQLPERHWYAGERETDDEEEGENIENGDVSDPSAEIKRSAISFADFLADLAKYARAYGQIIMARTDEPEIDPRLRNLRLIKSLQSYGFLMHLRVGGCTGPNFKEILKLTEALMVRRHTCRERSNENDTLFAHLCGADPNNPLPTVVEEFRRYSPPDERFREAFLKAQFNPASIERARYCLEQFEYQRQGKYLELLLGGPDSVHVEHIIPQKIKTKGAKKEFGDWTDYLGTKSEAKHPDFVSRIGNLTLFAGPLNFIASNNPYERKTSAYKNSAIKLTNSLVDEYPEFRFEQVEDRSAKLADLAVTLWPCP